MVKALLQLWKKCLWKKNFLNSFVHNSPFFFSDVDFDGEEELIINNWKWGIRHCNTYDVYKITNNDVKQLTEAPFINPT